MKQIEDRISKLRNTYLVFSWILGRPTVHEKNAQASIHLQQTVKAFIEFLQQGPSPENLLRQVNSLLAKAHSYYLKNEVFYKELLDIQRELTKELGVSLEVMPLEIILSIIKHSDPSDIPSLKRVNRFFYDLLSQSLNLPKGMPLNLNQSKAKHVSSFLGSSADRTIVYRNLFFTYRNSIIYAVKPQLDGQTVIIDQAPFILPFHQSASDNRLFFLSFGICYFDFKTEKFVKHPNLFKILPKQILALNDNELLFLIKSENDEQDYLIHYDINAASIISKMLIPSKNNLFLNNNLLFAQDDACLVKIDLNALKHDKDYKETPILELSKFCIVQSLKHFPYLLISDKSLFFFNTADYSVVESTCCSLVRTQIIEDTQNNVITILSPNLISQYDMECFQQINSKKTTELGLGYSNLSELIGIDDKDNALFIEKFKSNSEYLFSIHRLTFFKGNVEKRLPKDNDTTRFLSFI